MGKTMKYMISSQVRAGLIARISIHGAVKNTKHDHNYRRSSIYITARNARPRRRNNDEDTFKCMRRYYICNTSHSRNQQVQHLEHKRCFTYSYITYIRMTI